MPVPRNGSLDMRELPKGFEEGKGNIDRFNNLFPDLVEKWEKNQKEKEAKTSSENNILPIQED